MRSSVTWEGNVVTGACSTPGLERVWNLVRLYFMEDNTLGTLSLCVQLCTKRPDRVSNHRRIGVRNVTDETTWRTLSTKPLTRPTKTSPMANLSRSDVNQNTHYTLYQQYELGISL